MMPTHFLSSQVGSGSDAHCLSSSALTNATTSADVTAENNCNTQPTGAEVKDGASASAVAARTPATLSSKKLQVRRADICRRRWTPAAKQLIERPPKAARLRLLSVDACGPEGSTLLAKQFKVLSPIGDDFVINSSMFCRSDPVLVSHYCHYECNILHNAQSWQVTEIQLTLLHCNWHWAIS